MPYQIINTYKPLGWTPLQVINCLRKDYPRLRSVPMTYLGRLDPMAEGVLLILAGAHTTVDREQFLKLDKTYEAEILLGFTSDSYDVLGLAKKAKPKEVSKKQVAEAIKTFVGSPRLLLPRFSSAILQGKPLFSWARSGKLKTADVPKRNMNIMAVSLLSHRPVLASVLYKKIVSGINLVKGDFRQEKILQQWGKLLLGHTTNYQTIKILLHCGSGTYVRSVAQALGRKLGTGAVLLKLRRLRVGEYGYNKSKKLL